MCSVGKELQHIKESGGGEALIFNHYVTTNQHCYGSYWHGFKPTFKTLQGAGHVSNTRPVLTFSSKLDAIDNPGMINELCKNYVTTNQLMFAPYDRRCGNERIPSRIYNPKNSIFTNKSTHTPTTTELAATYRTEAFKLANLKASKYHRPLLWTVLHKDSRDNENLHNGPGQWSTQYTMEYFPKVQGTVSLDFSRMGSKEESGFTLNEKTSETISGRPFSCFAKSNPGWLTNRPTGYTQYQNDFPGFARRPVIVNNGGPQSVLPNGYTMGNSAEVQVLPKDANKTFVKPKDLPYGRLDKLYKTDRSEFWNSYNAQRYPSLTKSEFACQPEELRNKVPDACERELSKREETGTTRNNPMLLEGFPSNPDNFVTNNMTTHYWTAPRPGTDRQGYVNMNISSVEPSGYSTGTKKNALEGQREIIIRLPELSNYQGKSAVCREEISTAPQRMLHA